MIIIIIIIIIILFRSRVPFFRRFGEVKVATWSPDGQLLAFVDPNEGVGVGDTQQGPIFC